MVCLVNVLQYLNLFLLARERTFYVCRFSKSAHFLFVPICAKEIRKFMKKLLLLCLLLFFLLSSCGYSITDNFNADYDISEILPAETIQTEPDFESYAATTYILNKNTRKFHYPTCPSVYQIKDKNKYEFTGNRDIVIHWGYVPCKECNP